jgi:hypothetical protein
VPASSARGQTHPMHVTERATSTSGNTRQQRTCCCGLLVGAQAEDANRAHAGKGRAGDAAHGHTSVMHVVRMCLGCMNTWGKSAGGKAMSAAAAAAPLLLGLEGGAAAAVRWRGAASQTDRGYHHISCIHVAVAGCAWPLLSGHCCCGVFALYWPLTGTPPCPLFFAALQALRVATLMAAPATTPTTRPLQVGCTAARCTCHYS